MYETCISVRKGTGSATLTQSKWVWDIMYALILKCFKTNLKTKNISTLIWHHTNCMDDLVPSSKSAILYLIICLELSPKTVPKLFQKQKMPKYTFGTHSSKLEHTVPKVFLNPNTQNYI